MAITSLSQDPAAAEAAPTVAEEAPAKVEFASNLMQKLDDVAPIEARTKIWGELWRQAYWTQINPPPVIGDGPDVVMVSPTEAFRLVTEPKR